MIKVIVVPNETEFKCIYQNITELDLSKKCNTIIISI